MALNSYEKDKCNHWRISNIRPNYGISSANQTAIPLSDKRKCIYADVWNWNGFDLFIYSPRKK